MRTTELRISLHVVLGVWEGTTLSTVVVATMRRNSACSFTVTLRMFFTVAAIEGRARRRRPRDEHPQGARVQRDAHVAPYLRAERGVDDESFSRLRLVLQTRWANKRRSDAETQKDATRRKPNASRPLLFGRVEAYYDLHILILV